MPKHAWLFFAAASFGLGCAAHTGTVDDDGAPGAHAGETDAAIATSSSHSHWWRPRRDASVGLDAGGADDPGGPGTSTTTTPVFRPFTGTSPWNTRIGGATVHPDSESLVRALSTSSTWSFLGVNIRPFGVPCYFADANTPLATVVTTGLAGQGFSESTRVPIPAGATADPSTDGHLCIIDRARGLEWGFWQATGSGSSWTSAVSAMADLSGSGVRPPKDGRQDWTLSHGARACGFPLAAGLITVEEIRAGRIDHALVFAYPGIRSRYYTSPASTAQGTVGSLSSTTGVPCGGRIQLDPAIDVGTLGLTNTGRILARALQEYGAYIGDYSGAINFYADGSEAARAAWATGLLDGNELRGLDMTRLRVLAWGTLYDDHN